MELSFIPALLASKSYHLAAGTTKLGLCSTKQGGLSLLEGRMTDPHHLRQQARKCRVLSKTAIEPEVIEQLRVWSVELADEADAAERETAETSENRSLCSPVPGR
jgi:hypothetical protein